MEQELEYSRSQRPLSSSSFFSVGTVGVRELKMNKEPVCYTRSRCFIFSLLQVWKWRCRSRECLAVRRCGATSDSRELNLQFQDRPREMRLD